MTPEAPTRLPLTLLQEFRASYHAGPRAWRCAGLLFVALGLSPLIIWWALPLAVLFLLPAVLGASLGRWVGSIRDERVMRQLQTQA